MERKSLGKEQDARFFFDEANKRVIESEQYLQRIFAGIFSGLGTDTKGTDLRSVGEQTGDLLRKWEEDIVYISDRDKQKEKAFRRLDIYSFYFMIATEHKRSQASEKVEQQFGPGRHDKF